MTLRFKFIAFDWDGTLADSLHRIITCFNLAFAETGLPTPERELIKTSIGLPLDTAIEILVPEASAKERLQLRQSYADIWRGGTLERSSLFEGVAPMLDRLREQGYKLAVATSKSRRGLAEELDIKEMNHLFDATRAGDEAQGKPHPDMLQQLMAETDSKPHETLMIGDTEFDLKMARNAGVASLGVLSGGHPLERLQGHAPLACLPVVTHMETWLATLSQEMPSGV